MTDAELLLVASTVGGILGAIAIWFWGRSHRLSRHLDRLMREEREKRARERGEWFT